MKVTGGLLLVGLCAAVSWCQDTPPDQGQTPPPEQVQDKTPDQTRDRTKDSALDVKPGQEVIKPKDYWDETGIFHPFLRMPRYILHDQKAIWTSPFHTSKSDAKFWAIFGGATVALIATDKVTAKDLPNSSSQVSVSNWASRFGSAYSLIPISAGFYFIGSGIHHDRLRETGLLCFEALIDSNIVVEGVKLVADRARPLEGNGNGNFESSPNGRWNSSFPSGHSINTWALASVVAHQYPHPRIVPILAYAFATTVVCSRVGARQHFPGDVMAGSAMGWFIGDYVYGHRHNPGLEPKKSAAEKLMDHVRLGVSLN